MGLVCQSSLLKNVLVATIVLSSFVISMVISKLFGGHAQYP